MDKFTELKNNREKKDLTISEAAEFLEVGRNTAERIITEWNKIPYYDYAQEGAKKRIIRVPLDELQAYKNSRLKKAG